MDEREQNPGGDNVEGDKNVVEQAPPGPEAPNEGGTADPAQGDAPDGDEADGDA